MPLYGNEIHFDVYREGDRVGFHRVRFTEDEGTLNVRSTFNLKIDFLFFSVFQYRYLSNARWVDGHLEHIIVSVNDDGDEIQMTASRRGDSVHGVGPNGNFTTASPIFPTNHWNAAVIGQTRVLNTLTGRVNTVAITAQEVDTVPTENGSIQATRFAYSGDLDNEVWYDDEGRWVKMRFTGRDGSTIEYVCSRCQGTVASKAAP